MSISIVLYKVCVSRGPDAGVLSQITPVVGTDRLLIFITTSEKKASKHVHVLPRYKGKVELAREGHLTFGGSKSLFRLPHAVP